MSNRIKNLFAGGIDELIEERSACASCGSPATRLMCSIDDEYQTTALLLCEGCYAARTRLQTETRAEQGLYAYATH